MSYLTDCGKVKRKHWKIGERFRRRFVWQLGIASWQQMQLLVINYAVYWLWTRATNTIQNLMKEDKDKGGLQSIQT